MKKNFFKFLIVFLCFYFIYDYFRENEVVYNIIVGANNYRLLFIITLIAVIICLYAKLILITLTKLCEIKIPKHKWYEIYFNSQFLNSIPLFGIFYRALQLKKFNLNYDKFFGIYILINWYFIFLSLLIFSFETFIIFKEIKFFKIDLYIIFLISGIFFSIVSILFLISLKVIVKKIKLKSNYFLLRLEKLIDLFLSSISNKIFLKNFIFLFIIIHIFEFLALSQLIEALNQNVGIKNSFILFMGNILIDAFNILPQNLIISEIGFGMLTDQMNFNFELGVLIKIYFRFLVFFASVFIAILYNLLILLKYKKS
jgi:hypothetical protein